MDQKRSFKTVSHKKEAAAAWKLNVKGEVKNFYVFPFFKAKNTLNYT